MLWWAVESKVSEDPQAAVRWWASNPQRWESEITRRDLGERMMRRFAATGQRRDLLLAAELLRAAPDKGAAEVLLRGFEAAYRGRSLSSLPDELIAVMAQTGGGSLPLRVRQGDGSAIGEVLKLVADPKQAAEKRVEMLQVLGDVRPPKAVGTLTDLAVTPDKLEEPVRVAAIAALQAYADPEIASRVLDAFQGFGTTAKEAALTLLASRPHWSIALLGRVDSGTLDPKAIPDAIVRKLHLHRDEQIRASINKHWGEVSGATTAQMEADIDRYRELLAGGIGNPTVGSSRAIVGHATRSSTKGVRQDPT
jgi:hypothetical protein